MGMMTNNGGRRNYTIGILPNWQVFQGSLPNTFLTPILQGIHNAAVDRNINLLIACGVGRGTEAGPHPAWPQASPDDDFVPIGSWNTDGLIVLRPFRAPHRVHYIEQLQKNGHPILCIAEGEGELPSICVDSRTGIRQAFAHLLEHGHQKILFLAGDPNDKGDSSIRLETFMECMAEAKLNLDPRLIVHGYHSHIIGHDEMERTLKSGTEFTAMLASNDASAIGAMRALREAGLRIPQDVAVIGFDDQLEAQIEYPPLTTVHYPTYETGYRALEIIVERLEKGKWDEINPRILVPTYLTVRQTCGCYMPAEEKTLPLQSLSKSRQRDGSDHHRVAHEMVVALYETGSRMPNSEAVKICYDLVSAIATDLKNNSRQNFLIMLNQALLNYDQRNFPCDSWQGAISALHRWQEFIYADADPALLNTLLHLARLAVSDAVSRQNTRRMMLNARLMDQLGRIATKFLSAQNEFEVMETFYQSLSSVGVKAGWAVTYDPSPDNPYAKSILWRHQGDEMLQEVFPTNVFPTPSFYEPGKAFQLAVLPLFSQEDVGGYLVFDAANLQPCGTFSREMAAALKSARLYKQVVDLSLTDALTGAYNRRYFDMMLEKETLRSQRYNRPVSVIFFDLDHFKEYNDIYGHAAGDDALRYVAYYTRLGVRRGLDSVARYGGDEFVVILPETDLEGANAVAETIRGLIRTSPLFQRPISLSVGIVASDETLSTPQSLLQRADEALYRAKQNGRDQIVLA